MSRYGEMVWVEGMKGVRRYAEIFTRDGLV